MAIATDQQVQQYANERLRRRAEQFRALDIACADDKLAIDDVYAACVQATPTWTDQRSDGPPHLLAPADILLFNAVISIWAKFRAGTATAQDVADFAANWPAFQAACVRPVE